MHGLGRLKSTYIITNRCFSMQTVLSGTMQIQQHYICLLHILLACNTWEINLNYLNFGFLIFDTYSRFSTCNMAGPASFAYVSKHHHPQTARKFSRKRACGGGRMSRLFSAVSFLKRTFPACLRQWNSQKWAGDILKFLDLLL